MRTISCLFVVAVLTVQRFEQPKPTYTSEFVVGRVDPGISYTPSTIPTHRQCRLGCLDPVNKQYPTLSNGTPVQGCALMDAEPGQDERLGEGSDGFFEAFQDALDASREFGWRVRRGVRGEWENVCPNCGGS